MYKYVFYVGPEHHRSQLNYIYKLIGGTFVVSGSNRSECNNYNKVSSIDNCDVVWFFADIYENIMPYLKGKSIFVPHGLAFKPYLRANKVRIDMLSNFFTQIWSAGYIDEVKYLAAGIDQSKIKRVGYPLLLDLPELPTNIDSIFVAVGWFHEIVSWENMYKFVSAIPAGFDVYLSLHPSMPEEIKNYFINAFKSNKYIHFTLSQEEVSNAFSLCGRAVVGLSSVATPFHYLGKPVIYVKDRNKFPLFQWIRLVRKIKDRLFYKILSESTKILLPTGVDINKIIGAKTSNSAKKMFYKTNWSCDETNKIIYESLSEMN